MDVRFDSELKFRCPNARSYEKQKGLQVIRLESEFLSSLDFTRPWPVKPIALLGNSNVRIIWDELFAPRLAAAVQGWRGRYVSPFPGHTVPGEGAGNNVRYTGALFIEKFEHLLGLAGGFPSVGIGQFQSLKPKLEVENLPLVDWPWEQVVQPQLRLLKPVAIKKKATESEISQLLGWAENVVWQFVKQDKVPVRELLSFVRKLWSSCTKPPVYSPETLQAAREVISHFKHNSRREGDRNWFALACELEACLSYFEYSWPLNVSGYGVFNGSWLEVGRLPLADIQCVELVVTRRVLQELVNIRVKGFAPIVVNEYGCDTDGTHRITATWVWNLLQSLRGVDINLDQPGFQVEVAGFITEYGDLMGPLMVRESLSALSNILADERMCLVLHESVLPYVSQYYPVTHLPVLLLPEYLCGAVIKGPYDEETASYRVDPSVYEFLSQDRSCTLPARGPYHLTDRALLPWFEVLERR